MKWGILVYPTPGLHSLALMFGPYIRYEYVNSAVVFEPMLLYVLDVIVKKVK